MLLPTKARRPAEGTTNPFKLPRGEKLRRAVVAVFRGQRTAIVRWLKTGEKDAAGLPVVRDEFRHRTPGRAGLAGLPRIRALEGLKDDRVSEVLGGERGHRTGHRHRDLGGCGRRLDRLANMGVGEQKDQIPPVPLHWPDWDGFGLGALKVSERMTPILTLTWEAAADAFASRVGLDPNTWSVINPNTERMIEEAALAFCQSTNDTTMQQLDQALADLRDQLNQGIIQHGEALDLLTKRVNAIFDGAETWRARRIAFTETSRAVHAAQEQAAIHSGVVTGWKLLLSSDACKLCVAVAARCPYVRLGQPFAVIGDDPHYSQIRFTPIHPFCACTVVEILDTDPQPAWGDTLHDPGPATDDEARAVMAGVAARDAGILAGSKRTRPAPARRPAALARKAVRP